MSEPKAHTSANRRLLLQLGVITLAMFGFGYLMVPLYNVFCDITGIRLTDKGSVEQQVANSMQADESRLITVEFISNLNQDLRLEFKPEIHKMQVHPGKAYTVNYFARNTSSKSMIGQAVPNVQPPVASSNFKKTECFCFTNQTFEAGEGRSMPVRFMIDPLLPQRIKTVTLSYTFFDVTDTAMKGATPAQQRSGEQQGS